MTLRLDWVNHEAAKHACSNWHYSRTVPAGRINAIGIWEGGAFIGVVIFSRGSTPRIGDPYGLKQSEVCELTRVALREHRTPVSRIISIALKLLRGRNPGLRLIVSYAAGEQGHHGGIYQAGGWIFEGSMSSYVLRIKGRDVHARSITSRYGRGDLEWVKENLDPHAEKVKGLVRHKYLMPLDAKMRADIEPRAKPYPRRASGPTG